MANEVQKRRIPRRLRRGHGDYPTKLAKIAALRATGMSKPEISTLMDIPVNAVSHIISKNPEAMSEAKSLLARKMLSVSESATENAAIKLPNANAKDSAFVAGVMAQRAMELTGTAPQTQINLAVIVQKMSELDRVEKQIAELEVTEKDGNLSKSTLPQSRLSQCHPR